MRPPTSDITPHLNDIVDAVHDVLKKKGFNNLRVSQIHFDSGSDGPCPAGSSWKCIDVPPSGLKCGCFPD